MTQPINAADKRAFKHTRVTLRDLVSKPVSAWLATPPARRTVEAYRTLLDVPTDLAAAGFQVAMVQTDDGWSVTITKTITKTATLQIQGDAFSFAHALFQVSDQIESTLAVLETGTPRTAKRASLVKDSGLPAAMEADPIPGAMIASNEPSGGRVAIRIHGDMT